MKENDRIEVSRTDELVVSKTERGIYRIEVCGTEIIDIDPTEAEWLAKVLIDDLAKQKRAE